MSTVKVWQVAEKFVQKFAQQAAGQSGDVISALQRAKLWNIPNLVSPLMSAAQVPDHTKANVKINVVPGPAVTLSAVLSPNHNDANQRLNQLLTAKFGNPMTKALQESGVNVAAPINVDWIRVTKLNQSY